MCVWRVNSRYTKAYESRGGVTVDLMSAGGRQVFVAVEVGARTRLVFGCVHVSIRQLTDGERRGDVDTADEFRVKKMVLHNILK